jgi:hypothetical protein
MGHLLTYPGAHYPASDHITPSGNFAYRAPMQLEPTNADRQSGRDPRGGPPAHLSVDAIRPTLISQLVGYGQSAAFPDNSIVSPPPGLGHQDTRYYGTVPFEHQHPLQQQGQSYGQSLVHPPSTNASGLYVPTAPVPPPNTVGLPSSSGYTAPTSHAHRSESLMPPSFVTNSLHAQPSQLSTDVTLAPSMSATAGVGRFHPLPTQSVAFRAALGLGAGQIDERGGRGGHTGRKARGMARGTQGQSRGTFRR